MFSEQQSYGNRTVIKLEDAIHSLLEVALFLLQARRINLMLLDSNNDRLQVKFVRGYEAELLDKFSFALGEGVAGWVARTGTARVVSAVKEDPFFIANENYNGDKQVSSVISAPISVQGKIAGVINLATYAGEEPLEEKDLKVLLPIADQVGKALEKAGANEGKFLLEQTTHLDSLSQVVQELHLANTREELGTMFLYVARELFPLADSGYLLFKENDNGNFKVLDSFGRVPDGLEMSSEYFKKDSCLIKEIDRPLLILDRLILIEKCDCPMTKYRANSFMAAPLFIDGQVRGRMAVGSSFPNAFREADLHVMQIIAAQISLIYRTGISYSDLKVYADELLDSVTVGVMSMDLQGKITFLNKAAEKILAVSGERLLGKELKKFDRVINVTRIEEARQSLLATGLPVENLQVVYNLKGQPKKVLNLGLNLLRDSQEKTLGITTVFEDITSRLALEEQLRRTERLVVAGQLAAGAAHEVKNPLTTIKGFSQLLKKSFSAEDMRVKYLETMLDEVEQINHIIDEMDRLAKTELDNLDWLDLPLLIEEVLGTEREAGTLDAFIVQASYAVGLPPVLGNRPKLQQVFYHIIKNGLQSMPEGGLLGIDVYLENTEELNVKFTDTGGGIPEQDKEIIFNPFYTSRPERMGLGLAISYKTVREHGGTMAIDSNLGRGTVVLVKIPVNFKFAEIII